MADATPQLCACGCGEPTTLFWGKYRKFVHGHQSVGPLAYNWRNDDEVSYNSLHTWLRNRHPKRDICDQCGRAGPTDYALIKGQAHGRDRSRYRELCRRCHVNYDNNGGSRWRGVQTAKDRAGPAPACKCGCGQLTGWNKKHARWLVYAAGHR